MALAEDIPPEHYVCRRCRVPGHYVRNCPEAKKPPADYVCRICGGSDHFIRDCPDKPAEAPKTRPGACWFCLSNPDVDKQLIVSIGEECYLALAKGGFDAFHVLLVPIQHCPTSSSLLLEQKQEFLR